jgi:hypothetical protein
MSFQLTIDRRPNYLHVKVTGVNSPQTVRGYFAEVRAACERDHCPNVLIEEQLEGPRLSLLEVFQLVSEGSQSVWPKVHRIAYVDVNGPPVGGHMPFAETVAVNRGAQVRVFADVAAAENWLIDQTSESRD